MFRTDKDGPYRAQVDGLKSEGEIVRIARYVGNNNNFKLIDAFDRELSKDFLKGDSEEISAHRELLNSLENVKIVETEYKLPVVNLRCSANRARHLHNDDKLYQFEVLSIPEQTEPDYLYSTYSREKFSKCCTPNKRMTRTCVRFMVFNMCVATGRYFEFDDAESSPESTETDSNYAECEDRGYVRSKRGRTRARTDFLNDRDRALVLSRMFRDFR